jgi:hypothetical protein
MTDIPTSAGRLDTTAPVVAPPVLASDILREEVAPIAPGRGAMRAWLLLFAVAFAVVGLASREGLTRPTEGAFTGAVVVASLGTLAALVPAPYAVRAIVAALTGLIPLVVGARGRGPLAAIAFDGIGPASALIALGSLVPGALIFRARYRAFKAARVFLAIALLASLPALGLLGLAATDAHTALVHRLADGAVIAASLLSLAGFLGAETSGACTQWAAMLLLALGGRLAARALEGPSAPDRLATLLGAAGAVVAMAVTAVGLYQVMAAVFAPVARRVDVHRIVGPSAEDG